ncbi:hypothetical protein NL676_030223 [Syzygium grande]|nr:hypothetical protein NL676_030223 [Syzygium grande]
MVSGSKTHLNLKGLFLISDDGLAVVGPAAFRQHAGLSLFLLVTVTPRSGNDVPRILGARMEEEKLKEDEEDGTGTAGSRDFGVASRSFSGKFLPCKAIPS